MGDQQKADEQAGKNRKKNGACTNKHKVKRQNNKEIKRRTGLGDVIYEWKVKKWKWVGHLLKTSDKSWSKRTILWYMKDLERKSGRIRTRLPKIIASAPWSRTTQNHEKWFELQEDFCASESLCGI